MNLHVVVWDEDCTHWRARVIKDVDPAEPLIKVPREGEPWLAWNTPEASAGLADFLEVESVAASISADGDLLLFYRPAIEYWRNVNFQAQCHVEWLAREWPSFGEVGLEELNAIASTIQNESKTRRRGSSRDTRKADGVRGSKKSGA